MLVKYGSYVGTGVSLPVTGVGFKPDVVIAKSATSAGNAVCVTSTMPAGNAKLLATASAMGTGVIASLDADGFTLGTGATANTSGVTYYYVALKAEPGSLVVTTYTGTGSSLPVTGIGFQPDLLVVLSAGAVAAVVKFGTAAADSAQTLSGADTAGWITSMDADGFTVGTASANTNSNGVVFHVLTFKAQPGVCAVVPTYTGNGTSQTVAGAGFQPDGVLVKGAAVTTGIVRFKGETGSNSLPVTASAENTTSVTALTSDGFSVGSSANVNTNAASYRALALREHGRSGALLLLNVGGP